MTHKEAIDLLDQSPNCAGSITLTQPQRLAVLAIARSALFWRRHAEHLQAMLDQKDAELQTIDRLLDYDPEEEDDT